MNHVRVLDIVVCSVFSCFGPGLKPFHKGLAAKTIFIALGVLNGIQLQHLVHETISGHFIGLSRWVILPSPSVSASQASPIPSPSMSF